MKPISLQRHERCGTLTNIRANFTKKLKLRRKKREYLVSKASRPIGQFFLGKFHFKHVINILNYIGSKVTNQNMRF